jgi:hypothetical protein
MVSLPPQLLQTSACKSLHLSARDFFNGVMNTAAIVEPSSAANVSRVDGLVNSAALRTVLGSQA